MTVWTIAAGVVLGGVLLLALLLAVVILVRLLDAIGFWGTLGLLTAMLVGLAVLAAVVLAIVALAQDRPYLEIVGVGPAGRDLLVQVGLSLFLALAVIKPVWEMFRDITSACSRDFGNVLVVIPVVGTVLGGGIGLFRPEHPLGFYYLGVLAVILSGLSIGLVETLRSRFGRTPDGAQAKNHSVGDGSGAPLRRQP
jgi:hypothetical protein